MARERLAKDPFNIVITGVGGQGNVMASRVLANMLAAAGYLITIGETFGASQRGGSVMSHIRVSSSSVWSPQIPCGGADIVVSLEPIEALRVLPAYGNPQVRVLTNTRPIYPVGVIAGEQEYPDAAALEEAIAGLCSRLWLVDATERAVSLGNPILANIVMIGALAAIGELPIGRDAFREVVARTLSPEKLDVNLQAYDEGGRILRRRG